MNSNTREWVEKAEADFATALIIRRSRRRFARDIVCFHLQQCVEKYMKARLVEARISFPKTHDLERLLDLVLPVEPLWAVLRPAVAALTDKAVEARYPGYSATVAETALLMKVTKRLRDVMRNSLGL